MARERAMEEGQVKAEDLLVVLRTMSSSGKGKPSLMERAVGGVFFCFVDFLFACFCRGRQKGQVLGGGRAGSVAKVGKPG